MAPYHPLRAGISVPHVDASASASAQRASRRHPGPARALSGREPLRQARQPCNRAPLWRPVVALAVATVAAASLPSSSRAEGPRAERPLWSFGLVADIQHADKDDNLKGDRALRYRGSLDCLRKACNDWLARHRTSPLAFILSCGDIVDGHNGEGREAKTAADLEAVAGILDAAITSAGSTPLPVVHVIGNHCIRECPRAALLDRLAPQFDGRPGQKRGWLGRLAAKILGDSGEQLPSYFSRAAGPGWKLIVLDTVDLSFMSTAWPAGHPKHAEAAAFAANHPVSKYPWMLPWNGGVGAEQMSWLRKELAAAEQAGDRVIVAAHHPLKPGAGRETHLAWNHGDVAALLEASPVVALVLAGHDHIGGYAKGGSGTHFVTVEAMLEAPPGGQAHAIVDVCRDRVVIQGAGDVTSRSLPLRPWAKASV